MSTDGPDRFDLKAARLNMGLSQEEFALKCGVKLGTVKRLEAGGGAHPANAKRVADELGVQVTDLMPLEDAAA
jgi:transcriptional regulator with XRE-family HTH domain